MGIKQDILHDALISLLRKSEMIIMQQMYMNDKVVFSQPINVYHNSGHLNDDQLDFKIHSIHIEEPLDGVIVEDRITVKAKYAVFIDVEYDISWSTNSEDLFDSLYLTKSDITLLKIADQLLNDHNTKN
jgi:hypothetical protein